LVVDGGLRASGGPDTKGQGPGCATCGRLGGWVLLWVGGVPGGSVVAEPGRLVGRFRRQMRLLIHGDRNRKISPISFYSTIL
jgi:hypothetical protein